jgi:elongation factor 2
VFIATYNDERQVEVTCKVYPEKGTVAFGSGLHQWGFHVEKFACYYAEKFGIAEEMMETMGRLVL